MKTMCFPGYHYNGWPCSNLCAWAHNTLLCIAGNNELVPKALPYSKTSMVIVQIKHVKNSTNYLRKADYL